MSRKNIFSQASDFRGAFRFRGAARLPACAVAVLLLAGCAGEHSPDVYAVGAVQQANKVENGVVVGFRQVAISAAGTVGAVTGGAAGGILGGTQAGALGVDSALGAVGGTALGGIIGNTIERMTGDAAGWEYIVRKPDGGMVSVTQREPRPLPVGQKVLVIGGGQARIVPDYSVDVDPAQKKKDEAPGVPAQGVPAQGVPVQPPAQAGPVQPPAQAGPVQLTPQPAPVQPSQAQSVPVPAVPVPAVPAPVPAAPVQPAPEQAAPEQAVPQAGSAPAAPAVGPIRAI